MMSDKRRAVEAALKHPKAATKSTRDIAAHCGVSHTFVNNLRPSVNRLQIDATPRTVTRNGIYNERESRQGQRSDLTSELINSEVPPTIKAANSIGVAQTTANKAERVVDAIDGLADSDPAEVNYGL